MIAWLITTLLIASVCSAAMGLAWLIGLRRGWMLLLVGAGSGVLSGLLVTLTQRVAAGQAVGAVFASRGGDIGLAGAVASHTGAMAAVVD